MKFKFFNHDLELTKKYAGTDIGPLRVYTELKYQKLDMWYWSIRVINTSVNVSFVVLRISSPREQEPDLTPERIKEAEKKLKKAEKSVLAKLDAATNLAKELRDMSP